MHRQIKMSYADKNVRLTLDETSKLIKVEVRKEGEDSTKFKEVSSKWIGKVPALGELEEVLKEVAGVKSTKKGLFECFDSLKEQLFDAPTEVKESFNKVIKYFDTEYFSGKSGRPFIVICLLNGKVTKEEVIAGSVIGAVNQFNYYNSSKGSIDKIKAFNKEDEKGISQYEKELKGEGTTDKTPGKSSQDHCYIVVGLLEDNNGNKDTKNTWFTAQGSESDAINEFKSYFGNYKCSNIKAFRTPLIEVKGKSKSHKAPDWNSNAGKEAYSYESELYNKYVKGSPVNFKG